MIAENIDKMTKLNVHSQRISEAVIVNSPFEDMNEQLVLVAEEKQTENVIIISNLSIANAANGEPILKDLSLIIDQNCLIYGPSGCGKSSFVEVLSGVKQDFYGSFQIPDSVMFMPQRAILINGSLYDQISYPKKENDIAIMNDLITLVGLGWVKDRFHIHDWRDLLSPGEIQRLIFARVLYHKPRMVILDEASNAIEVDSEKKLYFELWSRNITTIIIRHDIGWLIDYCKLFIRLDDKGSILLTRADSNLLNLS